MMTPKMTWKHNRIKIKIMRMRRISTFCMKTIVTSFPSLSIKIVQLGPIPSTKSKFQLGPKQNTKVTFKRAATHHRKLLR